MAGTTVMVDDILGWSISTRGPAKFEMTDTQARALIELSGGDLGACIEFANAQAAAIEAEGPIQNEPPDEVSR